MFLNDQMLARGATRPYAKTRMVRMRLRKVDLSSPVTFICVR
jgi:hypothetical protein